MPKAEWRLVMGIRQIGYRVNGLAIETLLSAFLASFCSLLVGCGGSNGSTTPPGSPLVIVSQPASQTIPLNQTATFTVSVSGGVVPLRYQWTKDGAPIGGATSGSYVTPAVSLNDNNETFVVTVADSDGNVISNPATLTIGPRSPAPADLRFQQVAAPSTVNGYGAATGESILLQRLGFGIDPGLGTPLPMGSTTCATDNSSPIGGCAWEVSVFPLPNGPDVSTNYGGDFLDSFDFDMGDNQWLQPITEPNSVITSLHIASSANFFGVAYMTTTQTTGFQMEQHTVATSALQQSATQEGLSNRVITAITYNAGQVEYYSYGWTADTSTVYDVKVAPATFDTVPAAAASLAAQGYIITAFGGNTIDGFLLVGTRVQGDSLPRSIRTVPQGQQTTQLWQPGYAIVAVLQNPDYSLTYIGER